jgi:hypothetical protein
MTGLYFTLISLLSNSSFSYSTATMPAPKLVKLDFHEKLIQSGRKENNEAVLKRLKVSHSQS